MSETKLPPARVAFGKAIARLRGRGRSQQQLAEAIKTAMGRPTKYSKQSVISAVETGKAYVAIEDVFTFATALGVTPADMLVAWAEEIDPEEVAGGLLLRARLLKDLDTLQGAVHQATAEFITARSPAESPGEVQEMAALAAELMAMPKRKRNLAFRVVEMLNIQEDEK